MKTLKEIKHDMDRLYMDNNYLYISTKNDITLVSSKIYKYYKNANNFSFNLLLYRLSAIDYDLSILPKYITSIIAGVISGIIVAIFSDASNFFKSIAAITMSIIFMFLVLKIQHLSHETTYSKRRVFFNLERIILIEILEEQYGYKYN